MTTSSSRDGLSTPLDEFESGRSARISVAAVARSAGRADQTLVVRYASLVDIVERLELVRGRNDRLPAERLARQMADAVRELDELDRETNWGVLADALIASSTDPLGGELADVVERLAQRISASLDGADDDRRTQAS